MAVDILLFATCVCVVALVYNTIIHPLFLCKLGRIPGPKLYAITKWRLAFEDWKGSRSRTILKLHLQYGPIVRIGPNEVSFNSLSALRTIYGAGSGFERTPFYSMFDVYGRKNLFTFFSVKDHGDRKKLIAHAYSKSVMIHGPEATMISRKVKDYLNLIDKNLLDAEEIFRSLHYFSIDAITDFLYGSFGRTGCLTGNLADRGLLNDIMHISRRKLSWFAVHLPGFTKWMYMRSGALEKLLSNVYPMQKPTTYTGIREHALQACYRFKASHSEKKASQDTIISKLWQHHLSRKAGGLDDLDIASECADHLLAGIDTTADTLLFLIWALSRPQNQQYQRRLQSEIQAIPESTFNDGVPDVEACDKLPYLDAVIKETLRLYAPLPASEPRTHAQDTTIDNYEIPARTTVSMAPFSMHRNPEVFREPLRFNPDRWLGDEKELAQMKKWFWAFSSGGRMCIGLQ